MTDFSTLADHLGSAITTAEAQLRLEQAVYGLDAMDELALQSLLAQSLLLFYEVAREIPYPSSVGKKRSNRQRCDLVLCPKGCPLLRDWASPSLFDPPRQSSPQHALWLEIKVAYQFREGGVRHGGYGNQWRNAVVDDLRKMEAESLIRQAGLLLLVFNESEIVLAKDLDLFETVLMQKEVLAGFRHIRTIPILDRIGHTVCTVALWPTIQR